MIIIGRVKSLKEIPRHGGHVEAAAGNLFAPEDAEKFTQPHAVDKDSVHAVIERDVLTRKKIGVGIDTSICASRQ